MAEEFNKEEGFSISDTLGKTELFVENNKKNLSIVLGALAVIVGGYYTYKVLIVGPQDKEAQSQMFTAERYFEQDSLKKAINGDGNNPGFKQIIEDYGMTPSANLAHFYLGMSYLKTNQYQDAVDELKSYNAHDQITGALKTGALGDAYIELGQVDDAIENYLKAAKDKDNKFSSPIFLMKAAAAYESQNKFSEALDIYKQIKSDFFESTEGRDIEKYIARAEAKAK